MAFATGLIASPSAHAGTVTGKVTLHKGKRKRPVLSEGFVARKANPIAPVKKQDPRTEVIVVLQDGPVGDADKKPTRSGVTYELLAESFKVPLLPVVVGTEIDIKNVGKRSPSLESPDEAGLVSADPISPGGVRSVTLKKPFHRYRITEQGRPHVRGSIVGFPDRFFARLGRDGSFTIKDVPQGKWTVKLWYRDGWIDKAHASIDVGKRETKAPKLSVPLGLEAKPPGGDKAPAGKGK